MPLYQKMVRHVFLPLALWRSDTTLTVTLTEQTATVALNVTAVSGTIGRSGGVIACSVPLECTSICGR